MTLLPKITGALSLSSCIIDMHKTAVIYSARAKNKASADSVIMNSIACQKSKYISSKDAQIKNWLSRNNLFIGIEEAIGSIKGYFHGLMTAGARYLPQLVVSALTLATSFGKSDIAKKASYIGAIGIAVAHGFDFIHNTLNVGEKNNQLK